jgi:uncharacterized protein (DUF1015 family)
MSLLERRIEPFPALIFNPERAGPLEDLIAPPYDLIDPAKQQQLYARSVNNVVRLELNRDPDPYASAAETLAQWLASGILQRIRPAIFLYTQTFELEQQKFTRSGWVARVRLEEFASGRIVPHERTFPKAKEDRLRLLAATRANISSVFGLYPSGNEELETLMREVAAHPPMIKATDDLGVTNELRKLEAAADINIIQHALEIGRVLIADGHHRYETALEYRRSILPLARRSERVADDEGCDPSEPCTLRPEDYVMMTLVAFDDPGLVILPTHRIIRYLTDEQIKAFQDRARQYFHVEEFSEPSAIIPQLKLRGRGYIGVALRNAPACILHLRDPHTMARALPQAHEQVRQLDVAVLHALILEGMLQITPEMVRREENISYTIDRNAALAEVASAAAAGTFLLSPPTVYDVERVCGSGATMPEKSTYFYPKLQTGLLINPLY